MRRGNKATAGPSNARGTIERGVRFRADNRKLMPKLGITR